MNPADQIILADAGLAGNQHRYLLLLQIDGFLQGQLRARRRARAPASSFCRPGSSLASGARAARRLCRALRVRPHNVVLGVTSDDELGPEAPTVQDLQFDRFAAAGAGAQIVDRDRRGPSRLSRKRMSSWRSARSRLSPVRVAPTIRPCSSSEMRPSSRAILRPQAGADVVQAHRSMNAPGA